MKVNSLAVEIAETIASFNSKVSFIRLIKKK